MIQKQVLTAQVLRHPLTGTLIVQKDYEMPEFWEWDFRDYYENKPERPPNLEKLFSVREFCNAIRSDTLNRLQPTNIKELNDLLKKSWNLYDIITQAKYVSVSLYFRNLLKEKESAINAVRNSGGGFAGLWEEDQMRVVNRVLLEEAYAGALRPSESYWKVESTISGPDGRYNPGRASWVGAYAHLFVEGLRKASEKMMLMQSQNFKGTYEEEIRHDLILKACNNATWLEFKASSGTYVFTRRLELKDLPDITQDFLNIPKQAREMRQSLLAISSL
jgi:hypothetical protein